MRMAWAQPIIAPVFNLEAVAQPQRLAYDFRRCTEEKGFWMNVDMAKRLADRRRQAGLTQEALAEKLEVSRQAVSKWERSESSPDTDNLIALAQLYGVSLDELLYQDVDACAGEGEAAKGPEAFASAAGATGREEIRFEKSAWQAEGPGEVAGANGCGEMRFEERTWKANELGDVVYASSLEGCVETGGGTDADCGSGASVEEQPTDEQPRGHRHRRNCGYHHVGATGIHVDDGDDHVHISWRDGVNVLDKDGNSVHVNWDGIHVNDCEYDSLRQANEAFGTHERPHGPTTAFGRAWVRFPFPAVVILAYILAGVFQGQWGMGLFLFAAIPLYYLVGALIDGKRLGPFLAGLYPLAVVVGFCYLAFVQNAAHPAWVLFLTIPLVEWIIVSLSHWWQRRQPQPCDETA